MTDPTTQPPVSAPANPVEASAQLTARTSDPAWAEKFFAGDVAARREFADLTAAVAKRDPIAEAIAGTAPTPGIETTINGELGSRIMADVVQTFRGAGLSDGAIRQALEGQKVTKQELEAAKRFQEMRHGDAEWVKKLLSGDYAAKRESLLLSIIFSVGADEAA